MDEEKQLNHSDKKMSNRERLDHLDKLLAGEVEPTPTVADDVASGSTTESEQVDREANQKTTDAPSYRWRPTFHLMPYESTALKVLSSLVAIVVVLLVLNSNLMRVQKITVTGLEQMTKTEVLKSARLTKGQSIFFLQTERNYYRQNAQKNALIKDISVSVDSTNTVHVLVKENLKVGYFERHNKRYFLLADGQVIVDAKNYSVLDLPEFNDFNGHVPTLKSVVKQLGQLDRPIRTSVSEITYSPTNENPKRLILFMDDGNEVLVSSNQLARKLKYYPAMIAQMSENGVIDLQVGAFATPYGQ
ncbi:hypothetical protein D0499_02775 [Weissella soli]|uniref:cell division protein FtsQ/DivIB n=1 Tax=Weissella soli TaxID=155866 RepID=UPI0021C0E2BD|nr:cell division protein FtsQ/DivIB [Weissella soli]MCT8394735.1 hypothetical protein [Weissella soli]